MTSLSASVSRRCVALLSMLLEAREREAVLGDLAEEQAGAVGASLSILGLAARREFARWSSPRPWITAVAILFPMATLLIVHAQQFARSQAISLWLFASNFDPYLLRHRGFWNLLIEWLPRVIFATMALAAFAWCVGYVIGAASRRTRLSSSLLTCLVLSFALLGWTPPVTVPMASLRAIVFDVNAVVFRSFVYREILPRLTLLLLALLPTLRGIRDGQRRFRQTVWHRLVAVCVLSAALAALITQAVQPMVFGAYSLNALALVACFSRGFWLEPKALSHSVS